MFRIIFISNLVAFTKIYCLQSGSICLQFNCGLPVCKWCNYSDLVCLNFQIFIKAFSADNSAKSLLVDERMTVGQVCRLLADKNHVPMDPRWTLVEHIPELFMGEFSLFNIFFCYFHCFLLFQSIAKEQNWEILLIVTFLN